MDYEKFKKEYEEFTNKDKYFGKVTDIFKKHDKPYDLSGIFDDDDSDMVDSPAHYTGGRTEAIDVIEDAIKEAPSIFAGFLQAQVLKYMLRLWLKSNSLEDAEKARWYLNKLITELS